MRKYSRYASGSAIEARMKQVCLLGAEALPVDRTLFSSQYPYAGSAPFGISLFQSEITPLAKTVAEKTASFVFTLCIFESFKYASVKFALLKLHPVKSELAK